ncbi:MAG: hypothetical protein EZS28_035944 [Streblomastix strix]|uniref:Uncharacterized protein n=1 Tax=Streblomastix strix TaxID=222440 RepID=A0A5J4UDB2_9EUKA|nr:MAG: hypothetical protein EZS28_035944 [Streblomastix strix]
MADSFKQEGNALFSKYQYQRAIDKYSQSIDILEQCEASTHEHTVLFANRALCYTRLEQYQKALDDADQTLSVLPQRNRSSWSSSLPRRTNRLQKKVAFLAPDSRVGMERLKVCQEAIAEITLMNLLTRGQEKTPDIPDWRNIEYPKDYIGPKLEDYQDTENNDTNQRNNQHKVLNQQSGSSTANGDSETKVSDKFILALLEYIRSKRNQYHGLFGNPALFFKLGEYIVPHRLILQLIDKAQQILAQKPTLLVVQHPHAKFKEKMEKMKEFERKKEAELEKLQKQEQNFLKRAKW